MQAQSSSPIKTFTVGFKEKEYNEANFAKKVADYLGTEHRELYLSQNDALNVIPSLPLIYDEPFGDSSQIPTYLVSKLAREHVKVSLSGDAGDELFGGYDRYFSTLAIWNKMSYAPSFLKATVANFLSIMPKSVIYKVLNLSGLSSKINLDKLAIENWDVLAKVIKEDDFRKLYDVIVSLWRLPETLVSQGDATGFVNNSLSAIPGSSNTAFMMDRDLDSYLKDDILVKVDRAAMNVSLETRIPLLDHNLVEFVLSIPPEMRVNKRDQKHLLKKVLYKHVPEEFFNRKKKGFSIPIQSWLNQELKDWAEDLLSVNNLRNYGYLNTDIARHKWRLHKEGKVNFEHQLWTLLSFLSWERMNNH
jgi:asparagine synthase (glutamine-hydrolysing)